MTINKTEIEVRYQETDQMGVVYHANYLVWFEIGRTKFIEQIGFKYYDMEELGFLLPVIHAEVTYKKAIKYGETVTIETYLKHYDGIRIAYHYTVSNEQGEVAIIGSTEHTVVKKDSFRPVQLRKANLEWHHMLLKEVKDKG